MGLVQAPPKAWQGGGGFEVRLAEWKIRLLNLGSVACRECRLSVTGRVVVRMTELGPPGHVAWGCSWEGRGKSPPEKHQDG